MKAINKSQIVYTDGSCTPTNPGPGGWAFVLLDYDKYEREYHVSGGENYSTNNRMELQAVISALEFCNNTADFSIYSDSMYVINCAQKKWKRKKNIDMWIEYDKFSKGKNIVWVKVKAHNGDKYNEIVDILAKQEARNK